MINTQHESDTKSDLRYARIFAINDRPMSEILLGLPSSASYLKIRQEGASIRDFSVNSIKILTSPPYKYIKQTEKSRAWPYHYYEDFLQPVKIDATHTMLPVGKTGFGPEHGVSPYLDYDIESSSQEKVVLSSLDRLRNLGHLKTLELIPNGLIITDDIINLSANTQRLSLGEHLYFDCKENFIPEITLQHNSDKDSSVLKILNDRGEIIAGTMADFWPVLKGGVESLQAEFAGLLELQAPDGRHIEIKAVAESNGKPKRVDLLIWHQKDTDTICFEPIIGSTKPAGSKTRRSQIEVNPGESFSLTTSLKLLLPNS
jgi:hypothetical protein